MDNLGSHKDPAITTAIEAVGASLLHLPPKNLDFNPIENAVSPEERANFFANIGYDAT